jgi:hypothetical protein
MEINKIITRNLLIKIMGHFIKETIIIVVNTLVLKIKIILLIILIRINGKITGEIIE